MSTLNMNGVSVGAILKYNIFSEETRKRIAEKNTTTWENIAKSSRWNTLADALGASSVSLFLYSAIRFLVSATFEVNHVEIITYVILLLAAVLLISYLIIKKLNKYGKISTQIFMEDLPELFRAAMLDKSDIREYPSENQLRETVYCKLNEWSTQANHFANEFNAERIKEYASMGRLRKLIENYKDSAQKFNRLHDAASKFWALPTKCSFLKTPDAC